MQEVLGIKAQNLDQAGELIQATNSSVSKILTKKESDHTIDIMALTNYKNSKIESTGT